MTLSREILDGITRFSLSTVIIALVSGAMGALLTREMPLTNRDAVMLGLGVLLALLKDVFGYYFNATASGARKDSAIAAALTASTTSGTPTPGVGSSVGNNSGAPV